jgi:hypothetical protein
MKRLEDTLRTMNDAQLAEMAATFYASLQSAYQLPNGPEKAKHVNFLESVYMVAEKIQLQVLNS